MRRPLSQRLLFSTVAFLSAFLALELGAWSYEWVNRPVERSLPVASPGRNPEFNQAAEEARRKLSQGATPLIEDPRMRWGLEPDTVRVQGAATFRINSLGLRGPELKPKQPGELRLLSLGDSSIYGDGVPEQDVFSTVAAAMLSKRWGVPVSGVIGGVPGHDTTQSMAQLERVGPAVSPDWVVIGNLWSDVFHDSGRQTTDLEAFDAVRGPLRRFALYRVARGMLAPWMLSREVSFLSSTDDVGSLDGERPTRVRLASYSRNLDALVAMSEELGARAAFLMLPAPMDLEPVPPPSTVLAFREAMRQAAARHGAPLVDGPALFKERGATIAYFTDQVHPDRPGHVLLGEGLAQALVDEGP